jgi:imidazolonepropionase-like amidohydrolase
MTTWLLAERMIDGTGASPLPQPAIRVEDGFIREIRPRDGTFAPDASAVVRDMGSVTLIPGLVDAHVHLCFEPDGRPMRAVLDDPMERVFFRTLRNAQSALAAGVTTIRDCGGRGFVVNAVRDAIAERLVTGPRILSCAMPITTTRGHLWYCGAEADSTDELVKKVREFAKAGVDYIKVVATGGRNTPGSNVYEPQYRLDQLTALVEDSHRLELRVASHALSPSGIAISVRAGVDTVEHCTWYTRDGFGYAPAVVEEMKSKGIYAGFNFTDRYRDALDSEGNLDMTRVNDRTGELRARMRDAGLPFFLSTDSGVPYMPHADFALAIEVAAWAMRLSPMEAIIAATREPARAIGADEVGTLEVGKRADMVALGGNPLDHLRELRNVCAVLRDGEIVARRVGEAISLAIPLSL